MSKFDKAITINIPGSKSISNRALLLAVLSEGTTTLKNVAICDDTNYMIANLKKLGIKIQQNGTTMKVEGIYKSGKLNFHLSSKPLNLYTGNAGTTTRFLTALATLTGNKIIIDGDARMRERPIDELVKALSHLGAKIISKNGCPPITIQPSPMLGGKISLSGNISSQYLSAILMIAPFAEDKVSINIEQKLCSKPYVEMTLNLTREFGINIVNKKFKQFIIKPINGQHDTNSTTPICNSNNNPLLVESDTSSASYFGAYAALHPNKPIFLENIHRNSLQGDIKFLDYLEKMGCKIVEQKNGTLIMGPETDNLKSLGVIDMNETPDIVMTFAILSLFTKGKTRITNIGNLRIKETDRLTALENEINKLIKNLNWGKNIFVKTGRDWIEINNNRPVTINRSKSVLKNTVENKIKNSQDKTQFLKPVTISTYNDHRMAMSFGIIKDLIPNLKIENPSCVSKSYPEFWNALSKCQKNNMKSIALKSYTKTNSTQILRTNKNFVLIGLRGSGKSSLGQILAKKMTTFTKKNWHFIDIDEEIQRYEKSKIKDIVGKKGWEHFRKIEQQICQKVVKYKNIVISTGGGTIIDPDNKTALKKSGIIIYLHVKPEVCAKRIENDKNRPALTNEKNVLAELKKLYKDRHETYEKSADIIIKRSKNLETDAKKILRILFK